MSSQTYGNGSGNGLASALERITRTSLIAAAAGLGITVLGALVDPQTVMRSYLMAFVFWLGLPLGCISLLFLNRMAFGTWGLIIRRPLEAGAATIPVMTVLFLPVALFLGQIYPWAGADEGEHHGAEAAASASTEDAEDEGTTEGLEPEATFARAEVTDSTDGGEAAAYSHQDLYFARPFFYGRALFYFVLWNLAAFVLYRGSTEQDRTTDPAPSRRLGLIAPFGLILLFFSGTFAAFDWLMSLDPEWYSTIYGAMIVVGMGLETFAFINFATTFLVDRGELEDLPTPARLRDLGNLMLAFVMLWAYIAYSQFLIQWSGDLSEEIPWYLARTTNGWQYYSTALIVFHFFLPFGVLLFRVNKEKTPRLRLISGAIFVVHFLDVYWLTAPSMGYRSPAPGVLQPLLPLAATVGVGGIWLAAYTYILKGRPLISHNDPDLIELRAHDAQQAHHKASHAGGA